MWTCDRDDEMMMWAYMDYVPGLVPDKDTCKEDQFPILAAMARDLLSVQASTVALESAFSVSGRVISLRRTRLTPPAVEMSICLKDHLDAAERVPDKSPLEGEIDYESELLQEEVEAGLSEGITDEEEATYYQVISEEN
ncbi:hypothetical protein E3N88_28611 [Mikania micrantha]|uniref:HAT C-terminal dimerisation domain-containing protein n=1 Tax=Mikania micrantha TaxID=192012 RepID=A0A5N6N156_9ASTR|nr:hypothetical protein E3N88_28611 [Mikania micrantha]